MADFLLVCVVLSLPVIYLLESRAAAALYWIGIAWWAEAARAEDRPAWIFWLLVAAALPHLVRLVWKKQEWLHLGFVATVALMLGGSFITAGIRGPAWWILYYAGLFAFLSALEAFSDFDRRFRVASFAGVCGLAVIWLMASYEWPWESHSWANARTPDGGSWLTLLVGLAMGLAALYAVPKAWSKRSRPEVLAAAALIPTALAWGLAYQGASVAGMFVSNLCLAGLGLTTFLDGVSSSRLSRANLGLVMISGLAAARFMDKDLSFVTRGLGFIVVGLVFLCTNLYLVRRKGAGR